MNYKEIQDQHKEFMIDILDFQLSFFDKRIY
jgi:hypothetical protein